MAQKRVLIVYYSFSGQTQLLIQKIGAGLKESGMEVAMEKLQTVEPISFPFTSWAQMTRIMVYSFFRWRVPVQQPSSLIHQSWDYIILAGPTWSYNPSGPVLDFLDRFGKDTLYQTTVIPFISCRSYWRTHYLGLKWTLKGQGIAIEKPIVYRHCANEPWRTIGLFLQLMGKLPRRESSWFRKRYPRYGHSKQQCEDALNRGKVFGESLRRNSDQDL